MHFVEPHFGWRDFYIASEDKRSPFYGHVNSEIYFDNAVYNYVIHPQWDSFGSSTLFCKLIYADYLDGYAIIELIGEWNDAIENDIMTLKRDFAELLMNEGIDKFILIGENVLNFHSSDDSYYEEWFDDLEDGWICLINFQDYVLREMRQAGIDSYLFWGGELQDFDWTIYSPQQLFEKVEGMINKRLD